MTIDELKGYVRDADLEDSPFEALAPEILALVEADNAWAKLQAEIQSAGLPPHFDFWSQSISEATVRQQVALDAFNAKLVEL